MLLFLSPGVIIILCHSETFSYTAVALQAEEQENQAPVITGQNTVSTMEDEAVDIVAAHLQVSDPDDTWPSDFTIHASAGENYSLSDLTVTPAVNFTGSLSVPVTVNDGENTSEPYLLQITVIPVNDRPVITGQDPDPLVTGHNQPLGIDPGHLIVDDPDNSFPADFTLSILTGNDYTIAGQTVTPVTGFSGMMTVNVTVNDLSESSDVFGLKVFVAENTAPVITGQTELAAMEETPIAIALTDLVVTDPDNDYPGDFTLTLGTGAGYTLEGNTVVPAKDFAGELLVPAIVNDGTTDSAPFDLMVTITNINDPPFISGQVPLSTSENQGIAIDVSHLAIEDPDNSSFTLSILAGENYTVSGNLVTPAPGYNGNLTVKVFVNDGALNSNEFDLVVAVDPVNDPPLITGQRGISISEDTSIALSLADVDVTDPDNLFPDGFTLSIQSGEHYTFEGNVVTPSPDFTGSLYVNVVVNDGVSGSEEFPLLITVAPVNDPPVVTGQASVSTDEETGRTITLADLVVSDPDNNYPEGFTLLVFAGDNYTLNGHTVLPAVDFSGTLNVQVQVSDGQLNSNVFDLRVDVVPGNDKPVITGQVPVEAEEDVPVTIQLAHLTVVDSDNEYPADFTLSVSSGANYTVNGTTVQPAVDFNGTLNVTITVSDGITSSDPFIFQIQVGNANDAPVITGQTPLSTDEEQAVTLSLSHLTVTDPDNAYPTGFSLLVSPGTNYSVSGETITPALDFAGMLAVPVRVNDGVNNSPTFDFQLQVNQINDPPSFAAIANQQIPENSTARSVTITGISKGPQEDHQQLTFVATSGNTAVVEDPVIQYDGTGSTAVLSYTVKPNTSGLVTITIVAIDNGSNTAPHQNSYSSTFQVEVVEINSAPTLDEISNITIMEDAEQQNITLTGISAGPGETQTLTVTVEANKREFFDMLEVAYTSPAPTGLLRFKAKADVFGTTELVVTVTDNGSGVAPHTNVITRKFSVVILPVNDPPVFTSQPLTLAVVGEQYEYNVEAFDPDGEKITLSVVVRPSWASLSGGNNGRARLQGKPTQGALGNFEVTLRAADAASSVEQKFTLYVNARPLLSDLAAATEEDTPFTFPPNFFTGGYSDQNDNPLKGIRVTTLPASGRLSLPGAELKAGDTVDVPSLSQLTYTPDEDYYGRDSFEWNASDGYHFSSAPAKVEVVIIPVNDPPRVIPGKDTLHYEVDGEPALLSPVADIVDPDDDTLSHASLSFHATTYRPQMDVLEFQATGNIRGNFDLQRGVLELSGIAPLDEYRAALRSIRYVHLTTPDPMLEPKSVTFRVHDGKTESEGVAKVIMLQHTFVEFEIPTAFTPNGDRANDTWIIDRPGGGLEGMDKAVISVYNKQGMLVYRTSGFDTPWDGTMNGELLPADTYFFTIDLQLRSKKTYRGTVTILR